MRRSARLVLLLGLVLATLAGCSSDDTKDEAHEATTASGRSDVVVDYRSSDAGGAPKTQVIAQDNRFVPENVRINVGQTVRWTNQGRNQHDIKQSGNVSAYGKPFGVTADIFVPLGGTYEFTFTKPGVYTYYCTLHGTPDQGMVGAIIVGDAEWKPPEVRVAAEKKSGTLEVPGQYSTIQAAVDAAAEDALVLIAPGVYKEAVVVNSPNIVIRGKDRNEVILDGELENDNGFHVFADGVAIENLTVRRYKTNGVFWDGVDGYRGSYLTAYNNGLYGVYAFASVSGQFDHSYASGSPDSGFYIGQCDPCKGVITDVIAEHSQLGYSGTNASDVTIVNSIWRHNRIGIVPNSQDVEELPPVKDNTVVGNLVYDNDNLQAATADNALYDALVGSGIAMTGTLDSLVARNRVYDHDWFGIVLAPYPSDPNFYVVERTKVLDNVVEGSGHADLAAVFTQTKQGNCFARNTFKTSAPSNIEVRLACTGPRVDDLTPGQVDPNELLDRDEPEGKSYDQQPVPEPQPNMPDAENAKPIPARASVVPVRIDIDAIKVPARN